VHRIHWLKSFSVGSWTVLEKFAMSVEKPKLPVDFTTRRYELAWKYQLPKGKHTVKLKILNPSKEYELRGVDAIIYADQPVDGMKQTIEAAGKMK